MRKASTVFLAFLILATSMGCNQQKTADTNAKNTFQNGDIIFQSLRSGQSDAIQLATHSRYSHCGIIFWQDDQCYVFEAYKKVRAVPISDFIKRSKGNHYAVRRLKNASSVFATEEAVKAFLDTYHTRYDGKPYDVLYAASDDKIYCSELVWKLYKESANIDIAEWKRLRDFDLSSKVVQEELMYTYGGSVPLDEMIVSPEALYISDKLVTIFEQ